MGRQVEIGDVGYRLPGIATGDTLPTSTDGLLGVVDNGRIVWTPAQYLHPNVLAMGKRTNFLVVQIEKMEWMWPIVRLVTSRYQTASNYLIVVCYKA